MQDVSADMHVCHSTAMLMLQILFYICNKCIIEYLRPGACFAGPRIGNGRFGFVHSGYCPAGKLIAIKVLGFGFKNMISNQLACLFSNNSTLYLVDREDLYSYILL